MKIERKTVIIKGIRYSVVIDSKGEIARTYLYPLHNDLHEELLSYIEDVFTEEPFRGQGIGTELIVGTVIPEAKKLGCYKVICNSSHERKNVHNWYKKLGFKDWGKEFRMDL